MGKMLGWTARALALVSFGVAVAGCEPSVRGGGGGEADDHDPEPEACNEAETIALVDIVQGLAIDPVAVYWMDGGRVFRADHDAPTPTLLFDAGLEDAEVTGNRLTVDELHVYASGADGVFQIAKDPSGDAVQIAPTLANAAALAVTATYLYVGRNADIFRDGSLLRVDLVTGEVEELFADGWIYDLEADGEDVYWSNVGTSTLAGGKRIPNNDGKVGRVGPDGSTVLGNGVPRSPMGLGLDADHVYWAEYEGIGIWRRRKSGGLPDLVAQLQLARHVGVAPEGLYITADRTREIAFLAAGADSFQCVARLREEVPGHPSLIALSDDYVYTRTTVPGEYVGGLVRARRSSQ